MAATARGDEAPRHLVSDRDPAIGLAPHAVLRMADLSGISDVCQGSVGQFAGTALFLDVSGFTVLSERLGVLGSAGTEELVRSLNGFFGPAIERVRESGGEVAAFGGDAITAVWQGAGSLPEAAGCGDQLAELARSGGHRPTSVGDFELAVRIGVATGMVDIAVGGSATRSLVLAHGEAIDGAIECEHRAGLNSVMTRGSTRPPTENVKQTASNVGALSLIDPGRFAHEVIVERVRRGDTTLIDAHRRVTSLFAQLPSGGLVEPIDALPDSIRSVVEVVIALGGEVIQITGSDKGIVALATFGAPTSSPDDACRAVAAAMQLVAELPGTAVGIGTGTVFAGQIGSAQRSEYTVIGDAVNRAARLMQLAEQDSVLVDQPTATASATAFSFDGWEDVALKGMAEPVTVGRLAGQRGHVWPTNRLATDGPMLGRSEQLAAAEATLVPRQAGVRRVLVRGEAGVGKSRLGRALADRAIARGWKFVAGSYTGFSGTPYSGWQPILRSILDPTANGVNELERLLPGTGELAPILGPLLGLSLPETRRSSSLEGELRSELAEELAARAIEAKAHERPLMILLEDWHWADGPSARLLEAITGRSSSSPVTIVITQRIPLAGTEFAVRDTDTVIELQELGDDDAHALAASALARMGQPADPAWVDRIVELGGGNPLVVETLIDVGDESALTTGLAPLLQARLDALPDADLRPLLWVSAFGRPVVADELAAAMTKGAVLRSVGEITAGLDRLVSGGLLVTLPSPDAARLEFRHASVREAAYQRLSHESRHQVHHAVAVTLEERGGRAMEIAQHLQQTDDLSRQLHWYPEAGFEARAAWAVAPAITWFDEARSLGDRSDDVRLSLADMLMVRGEYERVGEIVADPCLEPQFDRRRMMIIGERAMVTGSIDSAVDALSEALQLADLSGAGAERCAAAELLSRALIETGRLDEAAEVTQSVIDDLDLHDHDTLARSIGAYGVVQLFRHDLAGAAATFRQAIAEAEQGQDKVRLVHLQSDLAAASAMVGDAGSALAAMLSAREVAGEIGYRRHLALSIGNEAELRMHIGDSEGSAALALQGLKSASALGDIGLACYNLKRLAVNPSLRLHDRRAILEPSMRLEVELHNPNELVEFRVVGIELARLEDDTDFLAEARGVLAMARELNRPDLELRVLIALGERADPTAPIELRSRLEEPGDRFLLDCVTRDVTGDHRDDHELRERGLALYWTTPFVTYRGALEALGVKDPPTEVVVPPREPTSEDPVYTLKAVLELVDQLHRLHRSRSS